MIEPRIVQRVPADDIPAKGYRGPRLMSANTSRLADALRCPRCRGCLDQAESHLYCPRCRAEYAIVDGIPDLIPNNVDGGIRRTIDAWDHPFDYDAEIAHTNPQHLRAIDEPLLAVCGKGQTVLEVGCGTARLRMPVEARGSVYLGLDPSLGFLRQALARGECNLVRGVGEYLPFPDSYFDTVIGGYCSFRYIGLDRLFSECARVIKPHGMLAFTLWNNWMRFLIDCIENLRHGRLYRPAFHIGDCNDIIWPFAEIRRLERFGFAVKRLLSTRRAPILDGLPVIRGAFRWGTYWRGPLGACGGYDVIFVCGKST